MPDNVSSTGSDNQPRGGQGFPQENRDGSPSLVGPDEYTRNLRRQYAERSRKDVLGGNFADLQRLGAQAAVTGNVNVREVVAAPPGVDAKSKDVLTPAQASAERGEWNRETDREGLLSEPPPPEPAENTDPTPVDPGNQSPTVVTKDNSPSPSPTPRKS